MISVGIRKAADGWGQKKRAVTQEVDKAVQLTALSILGDSKAKTPVDTGFARNSQYIVTSRGEEVPTDAADNNGNRQPIIGDHEWTTPDEGEAIVAVGAEYGLPLHDGTATRAGVSFLADAVADNEARFKDLVAQAVNKGLT